ncbi:IS256 family transposase [Pandoraea oxalativorans]|uniref:Mutator family transposase n=1 Tax=Pandoraea oxalativorans TaxID=573737 RepID=A0A0E3YCH9_9BURK|nr:IS256 family transposase [Pandoraea oxalativorans]AKC68687.1 transposase [Pandoraea oxalativorans]AKC69827.1 transposase [Pandoraea oxalativorans]AKC71742.2 transposase [Pandoraea oxalativorans]AKK23894.1 transposase [Pandoraea oxalativorans]AKK23982.1 transposase [Pandoraea oxalativorans]
MKKITKETNGSKAQTKSALDELIQQGARQIIEQAVEAELASMLEQYSNVRSIDGRRAVVRNGYLPEREVVTAIGPVPVRVPKVRDRSGSGIRFNSAVVPPYVRKSARVSAALPWLYLRGISTGDMSEAMGIMLGGQVSGLSPNVVSRLKAQWADEHAQWNQRELSLARWVYWWADGIHTGVRSDDSDGQCLLVIIGVKPDGTKERVAISDGYRESKASWAELLLDLKKRGLQSGPLLACGDGAMGFWAAMEEVFPQTEHQRCWFHKMGNVLNALPKSQQARAKKAMQDIWMAATRAEALVAFDHFVDTHSAKYPKVVEKLTQDRDELLAFYDFPAEHWQHLRTTNPIESTFATVRHRTKRTRNCVSRATFLGLAFKLIESAEDSWRRIRAPEKIATMLDGMTFKDGEPVTDSTPAQQPLAA